MKFSVRFTDFAVGWARDFFKMQRKISSRLLARNFIATARLLETRSVNFIAIALKAGWGKR
ncbi:hypothetical protein CGRAC_1889 [Campylobacter gracilis]|uniref:Uncharacterized protein n=1 Tax=Campylobacter gracilis RM3268 TaxID=553220 RepID=C8PHJ3_9BACT|nr:hypothetical protein CGRAC_1889 [Campylobacter gracilis]EEV17607.1 hypothetical protein CAMGR0001_0438 [Campylobacter gracilis RM3268]